MDPKWDDSLSLLTYPPYAYWPWGEVPKLVHVVRDSTFYALGLLLRGDRERAARAIDAVLKHQLDAPGAPFHGTWLRYQEEPMPAADAVEWRDYDPNWREFIGAPLAMILSHFQAQLPRELAARIDAALRLACIGAIRRNVDPGYTNIALMTAFLLDFAGTRLEEPDWVVAGERLAGEIRARFEEHGTFEEYNSPSYYAVDFIALALWRSDAPSAKLRSWGSEMEHALWRDLAQYYHPDMRNMAGPFDRAYGLDMRRYGAGVGLWIWLAIGRALAPYPDTTKPFGHAHDIGLGPMAAILGANIPEEVLPHFSTFAGPRQIKRRITGKRIATAWLEARLMLGGEWTDGEMRAWDQFYPGTVHWISGDDVHSMRIETFAMIDLRVEKTRMSIHLPARAGDPAGAAFRWRIHSPGLEPGAITPSLWLLPGLRVRIESEHIESSNPAASGDLLDIGCHLPAGKSGSMSMLFEAI
jgi:hypothetical protein